MKKTIYSLLFVAGTMLMASCSDFTDLKPKGANMLSTTDELELLLNTSTYASLYSTDSKRIGSNCIYAYENAVIPLNAENKTAAAIRHGFFDDDVNINRLQQLVNSDGVYTAAYNLIGRVANPILNQLSSTSGPDEKKNVLKAEALIVRAYAHYLAMQRFSKAYNGSNGDDPAIIYMTEDMSIEKIYNKNTINECYEKMLKDIDDALALNALPEKSINYMRWNLGAAYALKAMVCMAKRDYQNAMTAANKALAQNKSLDNYEANVQVAMTMAAQYGLVSPTDPKASYQYVKINAQTSPETYFLVPDEVYYLWTAPEEWNWLEADYGKRAFSETMAKSYAGFVYFGQNYEDYGGLMCGLSGWNTTVDFGNYTNAVGFSVPMMYLVIAECQLRAGNIRAAMSNLDTLRKNRMLTEKYTSLEESVTSKADAIEWMKKVMAGEMLWTDWTFIWRKRWNTETEWQTTISHEVGGKVYTLRPDSRLWVFPFPLNALNNNSNLTPNW